MLYPALASADAMVLPIPDVDPVINADCDVFIFLTLQWIVLRHLELTPVSDH
ncbi:MAG: hypothetical protein ACRESZ_03565 [Methylococcales bacterium]